MTKTHTPYVIALGAAVHRNDAGGEYTNGPTVFFVDGQLIECDKPLLHLLMAAFEPDVRSPLPRRKLLPTS